MNFHGDTNPELLPNIGNWEERDEERESEYLAFLETNKLEDFPTHTR